MTRDDITWRDLHVDSSQAWLEHEERMDRTAPREDDEFCSCVYTDVDAVDARGCEVHEGEGAIADREAAELAAYYAEPLPARKPVTSAPGAIRKPMQKAVL